MEKDLSPGSDDPQQAGLGCGNPGSWWVGGSVPEEVVRKGFLEEEPWSYKLEDAQGKVKSCVPGGVSQFREGCQEVSSHS